MSNRDSYEKITIEEFVGQMTKVTFSFAVNMQNLETAAMSFPEWYETFAAWLEVGTSEEEMMYHRMDNCYNSGCKICFK